MATHIKFEIGGIDYLVAVKNISTIAQYTDEIHIDYRGSTGADHMVITYDDSSSPLGSTIRNFVQDTVIRALTSNNNKPVLEVTTPIPFDSISLS